MDEEMFEAYSQWAEECLVWGRGSGNWCRAYTKEEWEKPSMFKYDTNEIDDNHPLIQFGK